MDIEFHCTTTMCGDWKYNKSFHLFKEALNCKEIEKNSKQKKNRKNNFKHKNYFLKEIKNYIENVHKNLWRVIKLPFHVFS